MNNNYLFDCIYLVQVKVLFKARIFISHYYKLYIRVCIMFEEGFYYLYIKMSN